ADQPEKVAYGFVSTIQNCLDWHKSTWLVLENDFQRLGSTGKIIWNPSRRKPASTRNCAACERR
ncbi:MAG TPA: hypothetical protein VFF11_01835, partial [Candidatus Binatia bacterium]|nr:hypothetical protein [Candidatus Binatia bacterium]